MSIVYDRNYVLELVRKLKNSGDNPSARLMWSLYEEVQYYKNLSEKAEGRLDSIGIPGYGW